METIQAIPVFESGFPLRVDDLDFLFNYLDNGERRTRTELIGAGILYGLEVAVGTTETGQTVTIKAGAGVTSQGHLYSSRSDMTFSKLNKDVVISSGRLTNVLPWMEGFVAQTGDSDLKVYELVTNSVATNATTNTAEVAGLTTDILHDRVLVIVFDRTSDKRNGCTTCNKGTNANVTMRYLLLLKTDWDKLQKCQQSVVLKKPTVGFPYMKRFGTEGTCAAHFNFKESDSFNKQYDTVVRSALTDLSALLETTIHEFAPFFRENTGGDMGVLKTWQAEVLSANMTLEQYAYDYTKHLIRAYNELVSKPFVQELTQLPAETCFPKYLTLTQFVVNDNGQIRTHDAGIRLPRYRPPFADTNRNDYDEARFLYERMIEVLRLENLKFNRRKASPDTSLDIKITPSQVAAAPLSNRAIPFYFDGEKMRSSWHFDWRKQSRLVAIAAYDRSSIMPFDEPLLYQDVFDEANFYRIEGHVGQPLNTVWNTLVGSPAVVGNTRILGLRTCLNLPFSVEIVELAQTGVDNIAPQPIFTTLPEFAIANPGLEHQGGVASGGTFILVVERIRRTVVIEDRTDVSERDLTDEQQKALRLYRVVADFCLPYRVPEKPRLLPVAYFEIEKQENTDRMNSFKFKNLSQNYDTIEWYIDGIKIENTAAATFIDVEGNLTYSFDFEDDTQVERTFVVTLVAKSNDADLPPDMATQGIAITQIVVEKVEPPVADFDIVSRKPFMGRDEEGEREIQIGETIVFENRSDHANEFVWLFQNKRLQINTELKSNEDKVSFDFRFGATPYLVRLRATNAVGSDIAEQEVLVLPVLPDLPIADFAEINRRSVINEDEKTALVITFENRSDHATSFRWEILRQEGAAADIWILDESKTKEMGKENFEVTFSSDDVRQSFKVRLIAQPPQIESDRNLAIAEQRIVFSNVLLVNRPNIEEGDVPKEEPITLLPTETTVVIRNIASENNESSPPLDDATVSQNLVTRHQGFRQKIETEGGENGPLSKTKVYKNVRAFIASFDAVSDFDMDSEQLDTFDKQFRTLAIQLANNTKREGGVPDAAYQTLLQNLLYAYLDNLTHLLSNGLTDSAEKTLMAVLQKIRTTGCFAPDVTAHLYTNWKSSELLIAQNSATITDIKRLFDDGLATMPSGNNT